ncbi:hypothetical protein FIU88_08155 [Halomonas sp. THAF12]|uniref:hypothetical protein n=1 Tax=Halomonas sp. THAF12 TaxID=2587849 RepID=UPI0012696BB7|nr:hypothetical protein [Halomonas sp. THAF12]QFT84946.1 hypothetical protein FIU88_08155 [Halomonas sp. THAF12]
MSMKWTPRHSRSLASLLHAGCSTAECAEALEVCETTIRRHRKRRVVQDRLGALRAKDLADEYYEGVAAVSEDECPYHGAAITARCWWMAGFHDAQRGMA